MIRQARVFARGIESGEYGLKEYFRRLRSLPRVIKSKDLPWEQGPVSWNKWLVEPGQGWMQTIVAHLIELAPGGHSAKHGHQNEALFYILDGKGHDIHDGKRYNWKAGDVLVIHNQCVHQHFNDDPLRPARILSIKAKPLYMFMHLIFQGTVESAPKEPAGYQPAGY